MKIRHAIPALALCLMSHPLPAQDMIQNAYTVWEENAPKPIPGKWKHLGPKRYITFPSSDAKIGGMGRAWCMAFHPTDPDTILVGAASGLWQTTQGGESWIPLMKHLKPVPAISDVVIDSEDPRIIYALTGGGHNSSIFSFPSIGVLKSEDGGNHWTLTIPWGENGKPYGYRLAMDPSNRNVLFLAVYIERPGVPGGIYKTVDGGESWIKKQEGFFWDLEFKPGTPSTIYAATHFEVYRSIDTGNNWTMVMKGEDTSLGRIELAVSPASPESVYALLTSQYPNHSYYFRPQLFRSNDSGKTFERRSTTPNILAIEESGAFGNPGAQPWIGLAMAVSPCNAEEVHAGSINTWKSIDGARSWGITSHWDENNPAFRNRYTHADIQSLAFRNSGCGGHKQPILYAATDGGLFMTPNAADLWYDLSANLPITQVYRLCGTHQDPDLIYFGTQDNGTNRLENGVAVHLYAGDGTNCLIHPEDKDIVYISYNYGRLLKSKDGGSTFVTASPPAAGSGSSGRLRILTPVAFHPRDASTLYSCFPNNLWKSTDRAHTWSRISEELCEGGETTGADRCAGIAITNAGDIFMAKVDNVYRLEGGNEKACWIKLELGNGPDAAITDIATHPTDSRRLWVTTEDKDEELRLAITDTRDSSVYQTTDGGESWETFWEGLPEIPANTIIYVKGTADRNGGLYLGTDIGVYYRGDDAQPWRQVGEVGGEPGQLPAVIVQDLDFQADDTKRKLRAGTLGWGIWELDLTPDDKDTEAQK